jgi:hypothetical protein
MNEQTTTPKGEAFNLENHIEYAGGSVVTSLDRRISTNIKGHPVIRKA